MRDSVLGGQPPFYSRPSKDGPDFELNEFKGARVVGIRGLITMLQGCFFTLHQYSIKSARAQESEVITQSDLRTIFQNFVSLVKCVMEYI